VYDSVGVGVIFYAKDQNNYYALRVKGKANDATSSANKVQIFSHNNRNGYEYDSLLAAPIDTVFEGSKDTLNFNIKAVSRNYQEIIEDGEISLELTVWSGNGIKPSMASLILLDRTQTRKIEGYCGIIIDYSSTTLTNTNSGSGIKVKNIKIQKVGN
jgi:hypothetical protein